MNPRGLHLILVNERGALLARAVEHLLLLPQPRPVLRFDIDLVDVAHLRAVADIL